MVGIPASEMGKGLQSEELVLIQGVIDAYIEEADGFILIDYKTDYVPKEDTTKRRRTVKRTVSGAVRLLWKSPDPAHRKESKRKMDLFLWIKKSNPVGIVRCNG